MRYIKLTTGGFVHLIKPDTMQTICGRDYLPYDYMTLDESELNPNIHVICHKCSNKRRKGPHTIKRAFVPGNFLG